MKFSYSYIIYKIYSWSAEKRGDTPIAKTIITLGVVHFFQFSTISMYIDRFVTPMEWMVKINTTVAFFIAIIYFILLYFLLYNKKRWDSYVERFSGESEHERKRGNIAVISFLVGSIALFFVSLPIVFGNVKH